jgi:HEAT repeat protein
MLSALLIKQLDKDPKNPNRVTFLKFNASAQRQAAELEEDAAKKRVFLAEATDTYTKLLKETPGDDGLKYDLALCEFDLAETDPKRYVQAQKDLKELVPKLGKPEMTITDPLTKEPTHKPNPVYWQGIYELLRSSVEVAKLDPEHNKGLLEGTRESLRTLLVTYPNPPLFEDEFIKLRKEILPDWDPNVIPATQATTKPAVAPAPAKK